MLVGPEMVPKQWGEGLISCGMAMQGSQVEILRRPTFLALRTLQGLKKRDG